MKLITKVKSVNYNSIDGASVTLGFKPSQNQFTELQRYMNEGTTLETEIDPPKKKRSLDQNSYAWVLMEQLAKVMNTSKEEIYEIMLQRYGTLQRDLNNKLLVIPNEEILKSTAELHLKYIGDKVINGQNKKLNAVIKGSSQYDTKEMKQFLDGIITECDDNGIETLTEEERIKRFGEI